MPDPRRPDWREGPRVAKQPLKELPADVMAAAENTPAPVDKLDAVTQAAERVREILLELGSMQDRIGVLQEEYNRLTSEVLVERMDEARMSSFDLVARDNYPPTRIEVKPFARAGIAASWPQEKRQAAFDYLESQDAGHLITTDVVVSFDRDHREEAKNFILACQDKGVEVEVSEAVNWQTLTSWLRSEIAADRMPDLDKIGGFVGRMAQVVEIDPDTGKPRKKSKR